MGWTDYLADRAGRFAFLVHIEGCPRVFVTDAPLTAAGGAYPAPVDQYGNTFSVSEVLSVAGGVDASEQKWKREEAVVDGGDFTIELTADATIRDLFATRKSGMAKTMLTVDVDHDDASFTVVNAAVLPAPGGGWATAYRGRETFQYDQVAANVLGGAGHIRRGAYGWQSDSVLARHHIVHDGVSNHALYVTDHPTTWRGRRVTLVRLPLDERGYALATTWQGGTEIRTGFIREADFAEWGTFRIVCNDVTYALKENEIGRGKLKGMIATSPEDAGVYLPAGGTSFRMEFGVGGTTVPLTYYTLTDDGTDGGTVLAGYQSSQYLGRMFALRIQTAINTATGADNVAVHMNWVVEPDERAGGNAVATGNLAWVNGSAPASGAARITLIFDGGIWQYLNAFQITPIDLDWDAADGAGGGLKRRCVFDGVPLSTVVPATAEAIPAKTVSDEGGVPADPATSGYAKLSNGESIEIISYTGTTALTQPPASWLLTGCTRGLFGTTAQAWSSGFDNRGHYLGDSVTIEFLSGWGDESADLEGTDAGTIALHLMLSTGTTGAYHATYDAKPYGLALDPACVNINPILAVLKPIRRRGLIEDAITFGEFFKSIALLHGIQFLAETDSTGRCRLTCRATSDPLASQYAEMPAFSTADGTILLNPAPKLVHSYQRPIDRVVGKLSRYAPTGEASEEVTVVDGTREQDEGPGRSVEVTAWGFVGDAREDMAVAAATLFHLYDVDEYELSFATTAKGQSLILGDGIVVTVSGIPNMTGTTGFTDQPAIVTGIKPQWFENAAAPGAVVTCRLHAFRRGWAPSYKISVYDAGPPVTVTLADNEFSQAGDVNPMGLSPTKDWHFGPYIGESFEVYVYEDGDEGNRQACTASYSSAGVWTLDVDVVAAGGFGAAPYYAVFASYDTAGRNSKQGDYAHIADTTPTLGAAGDEPHYWVA